jgi:hypothetical protein
MKSFSLGTHTEPDMAVTGFGWQTDDDNVVTLAWTWPKDEKVKYMLVMATEDGEVKDPLKRLMESPQSHTVVTRNLSARYAAPIKEGRKRYITAPAYLMGKDVVVYGPAFMTGWLYAKTPFEIRITDQNLPFSLYKKVKFSLRFADERGAELARKALRYALHEFNRQTGGYPLDEGLLAGGYMYIRKTQCLRFTAEKEYEHLIAWV